MLKNSVRFVRRLRDCSFSLFITYLLFDTYTLNLSKKCNLCQLHSHVRALHSHVKGLHSYVRGLHSHVRGLHSHVKGLHSHVKELHSHVRALHSYVKALHSHVRALHIHVKGLHSHVRELQIYVIGLHTLVNEEIKGQKKLKRKNLLHPTHVILLNKRYYQGYFTGSLNGPCPLELRAATLNHCGWSTETFKTISFLEFFVASTSL